MNMTVKSMNNKYYPVALGIDKCLGVVIGGGRVAQRKALDLLRAGARVKIISPTLTTYLKHLAKTGRIKWLCRMVRREDLARAEVIIAATDQWQINKEVSLWAKRKSRLVNVVDNPGLSNFISLAVFRKAKAIVAVYTNGRDPVLSRDLKNFLKEYWNEFVSYRNRLLRNAAPNKGSCI